MYFRTRTLQSVGVNRLNMARISWSGIELLVWSHTLRTLMNASIHEEQCNCEMISIKIEQRKNYLPWCWGQLYGLRLECILLSRWMYA